MKDDDSSGRESLSLDEGRRVKVGQWYGASFALRQDSRERRLFDVAVRGEAGRETRARWLRRGRRRGEEKRRRGMI